MAELSTLLNRPRTYTNHFDSMRAACNYFAKKEGLTRDQVKTKLFNQDIFIGYPPYSRNQILGLDGEGRYYTIDKQIIW